MNIPNCNPIRVKIALALKQGTKTTKEICDATSLCDATVRIHLRIMEEMGLCRAYQKDRENTHYWGIAR